MQGDFVDSATGDGRRPTIDHTSGGVLVTQASGSLGQQAASASLSVVQASITPAGSSALEKSHVISASACTIRWAKALYNGVLPTVYLFVLDRASYGSDGGTPALGTIPIPIGAGDVDGDAWPDGGLPLPTGCVLALSSTLATCTRITSDDAWFAAGVQ